MERYLGGRRCLIYVPPEQMAAVMDHEVEGLADQSLAVDDVEVGFFAAKAFGSGEHTHAAGCRSSLDPGKLKQRIIHEISMQM